MISWKTNYTGKFQTRTAGGRLLATDCSIEHAEFTAERGRSRDVWKWDDSVGRYRHYRTYNSGGFK